MVEIKNLTLGTEEISVRGETLKIFFPAKLEESFREIPF